MVGKNDSSFERNASKSILIFFFFFGIGTVEHFALVLFHVTFLPFTPFQLTLLHGVYFTSLCTRTGLLTPAFAYFKSSLLKTQINL